MISNSITAHYANSTCRRQIEKSPLAQIEMSLSAVSVGEHWADDGDYDEPYGDGPDERVARSGGWQDQGSRRIDVDGAWAASGVSAGEGVWRAWPAGAGVTTARQAKPGWRRSADRTRLRSNSLLTGNFTGNFAIS